MDIFGELEKKLMIAADDVSLLLKLMGLIHRNDLLRNIKLYCTRHNVKEVRTGHISKYRLLLLEIADNTSDAELDSFKQACKDFVGQQALSKIKNVYQLFTLLEEREKLSSSNLKLLWQLLNLVENIQMLRKIEQLDSQPAHNENTAQQPKSQADTEPEASQSSLNDVGKQMDELSIAASHIDNKPSIMQATDLQRAHHEHTAQQPESQVDTGPKISQSSLNDVGKQMDELSIAASHIDNKPSIMQETDLQPAHHEHTAQQPESQVDTGPKISQSSLNDVGKQMDELSIAASHIDNKPSIMQETAPEGQVGNVIAQTSLPEYRMERNPRGLCLIINNAKFENPINDRAGSNLDSGKLVNLFNKLHFEVEVKDNLKASEMLKRFKNVSKNDHARYDCLAVCILTHGKLGTVSGTDDGALEIQNILGLFSGISCQSLVGKPKMFFIQACQGSTHQEGVKALKTDEPHGIAADLKKTLPKEADFLMSYSTVPGYVSYRHTTEGSWYVNALVDQMTKLHNTTDMLSILTVVNQALSDMDAQIEKDSPIGKQVPTKVSTLNKALYLRSLDK